MTSPNKINSASKLIENSINLDERLLTKKEIAEFLNVSIKTIDRKVMLKEIPFFKIGTSVRFSKKRVMESLVDGLKTG